MALTRRAMFLGLLAAGLHARQASAKGLQVEGGLAFGSSWRVTTGGAVHLAAIRPKLEAVFRQVDEQMSPYRASSHLSVFNESRGLFRQNMPPELCAVSGEALRIAKLTDGAFDPTVGPLVSRFGFGPIRGGSGSFRQIEVAPNTLRKALPDLTLDLCGIAKGFALDRAAEVLVAEGVSSAMIELGGEVKALGRHPSGRDWVAAVSDPTAVGFQPYRLVTPFEQVLATSGHAANGVSGLVSTSHIIDTKRLRPASTELASVSVLASSGMEADALATALCASGAAQGIALARRLDVSALFVVRSGHETSDVMTGRFADHVLI